MTRWDILNKLIKKNNYKNYLEIGVQNPASNFDKIDCENKVGVEPKLKDWFTGTKPSFIGTSDEYFESISGTNIKFDVVFIDGLHHDDQVVKDIENSLKHLKRGGIIMCHDCLPSNEREQERNDHGGVWLGDVWKGIALLRMTRSDLQIEVVDTDCGCGLIKKKKSKTFDYDSTKDDWRQYSFYKENRNELMNVIDIGGLKTKYLNE